jgi:hypothetical protein
MQVEAFDSSKSLNKVQAGAPLEPLKYTSDSAQVCVCVCVYVCTCIYSVLIIPPIIFFDVDASQFFLISSLHSNALRFGHR